MALQFDLDEIGDDQIARLMEMLAKSDVDELEIEQGDCKICLKRISQADTALAVPGPASQPQQATKPVEPPVVPAPAVGIFFRSEKRSGPPKVDIGDKVRVGDVIGFIQVVNVPHSVHSTHEGVIESFFVDNGQPVEYGQPLISIQQSAISN